MIPIKTEQEIRQMRKAGKVLAEIVDKIQKNTKPGITTAQLNDFAEDLILKSGAEPAFKGYRGFPATSCISVNEEIVHGIPSDRILKDKDIVSVDLGIKLDGYFADVAFTLALGNVNGRLKKLVDVTKRALDIGISKASAGNRLSDISHNIQTFVESNGFSVVRDFVGHGIGKELHEDPEIPNFGQANLGPELKPGMVLAIEPMVNMGTYESKILSDGWTAVTKDRLPSAHFEHTVAVTENGPQVLTK
ncbi:MAG: type I methionyl aminopeptidase [Candidatus Omnitrophica bacterium]|nr:type I methionyl aminopeptidase [Candidatus Omnitrophota bacterium]